MKLHPFLAAFLLTSTRGAAEPRFSDVLTAGKEGFKSIRIPSVVVTKRGTVLAFAEGRAANADQAQNDIILQHSIDGGRTRSPLQLVRNDSATWTRPRDVTRTTKRATNATAIASGAGIGTVD